MSTPPGRGRGGSPGAGRGRGAAGGPPRASSPPGGAPTAAAPAGASPKKMKAPPGSGVPPKGMPSAKSPVADGAGLNPPVAKGPPGKKSPAPAAAGKAGSESPSPPPGGKGTPKKAPPPGMASKGPGGKSPVAPPTGADAPKAPMAGKKSPTGPAAGKKSPAAPAGGKKSPAPPAGVGVKGKSPIGGPPGSKSPVAPGGGKSAVGGKTPLGGKKSPMPGKGMVGKKAPLPPGSGKNPMPASGGASRTASGTVQPDSEAPEGEDISDLPPPSPREGDTDDHPDTTDAVSRTPSTVEVSRTDSSKKPIVVAPPRNPIDDALAAAAAKQAQCKVLVAIDEMVIAGLDWRQHKLAFPVPMNVPLKILIIRSVQARFKIDDVLEYAVPVTVTGKDLASLAPNYTDVIQLSLTPTQLGWKPDSFNWVWLRTITNSDRNDPKMRQKTVQEVYTERVSGFYELYDESKCNTAEALVEDFEGCEDLLIVQLTAKYGPEPSPSLLEAKRSGKLPANVLRQHIAAGTKADDGITPQSLLRSNAITAGSVFGGGAEHRHQGGGGGTGGRNNFVDERRSSRPFDDGGMIVGGMSKSERFDAIQDMQRRLNLSSLISRSSESFMLLTYYRKWRLWRQWRQSQAKACTFLLGAASSSLRKEFYLRWRQAIQGKKYVRQVNAKSQQAEKSDSLISGLAQENSFLKTELKKLRAQLEVLDNTNSRRLETLCNSSELAVNQIKALSIENQEKELVIRRLEQKLMSVGNMMLQANERKDFALKESVKAQEELAHQLETVQANLKDTEDAYIYSQHLLRQTEKKGAIRKKLLSQVGLSSRDLKLMTSQLSGEQQRSQSQHQTPSHDFEAYSGDDDYDREDGRPNPAGLVDSVVHQHHSDSSLDEIVDHDSRVRDQRRVLGIDAPKRRNSSTRRNSSRRQSSRDAEQFGNYDGIATDSEEDGIFAASDEDIHNDTDTRLESMKRRKKIGRDHLGVEEAMTVNIRDAETGEIHKKKLSRCKHCPHYSQLQETVDAHQRAATDMRARMGDLEEALSRLQEMYNTTEEDNASLRKQLEERVNATGPLSAQQPSSLPHSNPTTGTRGNRAGSIALIPGGDVSTNSYPSTSRTPTLPNKGDSTSANLPKPQFVTSNSETPSMSGSFRAYPPGASASFRSGNQDIPASILKVIGGGGGGPSFSDPNRPQPNQENHRPNPAGRDVEHMSPVNPYMPPNYQEEPGGTVNTSLRSFFEADCRLSQERMKLQMSRKLASPRVSLLPRQRDVLVREREKEREYLLYGSMNGTTALDSADAHARATRDRERGDLESRYMLLATGAGGNRGNSDYRRLPGPHTELDANLLTAAEKLAKQNEMESVGVQVGKRPTAGVGQQHNYMTVSHGEGGSNPEVGARMKRAIFS